MIILTIYVYLKLLNRILALTIPICVFVIILIVTLVRYSKRAQQNRCDYTTNSNVSYPRLTTINRPSDYPANNTQPTFTTADNSAYNFDMNMNKISKLNLLLIKHFSSKLKYNLVF